MENNNETWKPVVGYEGLYEVSTLGRVRSFFNGKGGRILKPFPRNEYLYITFCKDGYKKVIAVHRVVSAAFIRNEENRPMVNHKNCNKADNRLENLEWATSSENCKHSYANDRRTPPSKGRYGFGHWRTRRVLCLITGQIVTTKEASEFLSVGLGMMNRMLLGKSNNWTNYVYA